MRRLTDGLGWSLSLLCVPIEPLLARDTVNTSFADNTGLSRAIKLSDIESDISVEAEVRQLEEWTRASQMPLNGKKTVK